MGGESERKNIVQEVSKKLNLGEFLYPQELLTYFGIVNENAQTFKEPAVSSSVELTLFTNKVSTLPQEYLIRWSNLSTNSRQYAPMIFQLAREALYVRISELEADLINSGIQTEVRQLHMEGLKETLEVINLLIPSDS
jgi:hypothetical protein